MRHTLILVACLGLAWLLSAGILAVVPRFERWGDRRALHHLALWSPLLALGLAGGWSAQMALDGCLMFTTLDGIGTLLLAFSTVAMLLVSGVRESWRVMQTGRGMAELAEPLPDEALRARIVQLASALAVKPPKLMLLQTRVPVACVAGFLRPALFVSRGMMDALSEEELEALLAHELAHLRHQDNLLAWLGVILLGTFSFLPPLKRAWLESLAEREEAADAQAARVTAKPLALASALLRVAELGAANSSTAYASFFSAEELLERRIERLMAYDASERRAWGTPAVAALAFGAALPFATAWALGAMTSCLVH